MSTDASLTLHRRVELRGPDARRDGRHHGCNVATGSSNSSATNVGAVVSCAFGAGLILIGTA
jgi:hypothetical protein